ncbi:MAG: hypothetical protein IIB55_02560 [Planctomycetes bacterium]|nr:hypothetical protein [Planctomycetota bacterium]
MTRHRSLCCPVAVCVLIALGGCDDATSPGGGAQSTLGKSAEFARNVAGDIEARDAQTGGMADAITGSSARVELAGLAWSIPSGWSRQPAGMMDMFSLVVPGSRGSETAAKFYVDIGGGVQANLERWKGQMTYAGGPTDARIETRTLSGHTVTTIAMEGTYMMRLPSGANVRRNGYAFRGAIIEGPRELVFIKLVGPEELIEVVDRDWRRLISSMQAN